MGEEYCNHLLASAFLSTTRPSLHQLMDITFKNLGQIKKSTLPVKQLSVIIGPNNSNKTYVAYSIYGILRALRRMPIGKSSIVRSGAGQWTLEVNRSLVRQIRAATKKCVNQFVPSLTDFFQDTSSQLFAATEFTVALTEAEILASLTNWDRDFNYRLPTNLRLAVSSGDSTIVARIIGKPGTDVPTVADEVDNDTAFRVIWQSLIRKVYPLPFLFPAERNAFVITYKTLIGNRNKELVAGRRIRRANLPLNAQPMLFENEPSFRYPRPVEDFLQFLYDSEQMHSFDGSNQYSAIASLIETQLQDANRTHYRDSGTSPELAVRVSADLTIDLYNASSSIKQLAPLLIYLRQRATPNDLIIIDEPEMNLHPLSQAKLLEVLAILVNSGIKVLLTTHSPYIMQHLNNLVLQQVASNRAKSVMSEALLLHDERAFLTQSQVGAYEMRDYELVSLADEDYGIRWDTLSDVSLKLQELYFNITELERSSDG